MPGRPHLPPPLSSIGASATPEATALVVTRAILGVSRFAAVGVLTFRPDGTVEPLAVLTGEEGDAAAAVPVPHADGARLRERGRHGPWTEPGGTRVVAYVPIATDGELIGLLVIVAPDDGELDVRDSIPALAECGALAGAVLGPALRARNVLDATRTRIAVMLDERAFVPVFQPIVDLRSGAVVGYEALTRFTDGSPPDRIFADAADCGLAIDLEAATLRGILAAWESMPQDAWLHLNVSAEFVLAGEPLATIVGARTQPTVLELTEHAPVGDYPALRDAIAALGPGVRLAVDDAGAGFASLRHILELRPRYVKLDRELVRQVDRDPARQALVAGMVHFAERAGILLVAEGIELEAQARRLRRLAVPLGQGFRLGRPAPAPGLDPAVRLAARLSGRKRATSAIVG